MRRANAAELNAIRDGALSFDALQLLATELQEKMQEAARESSLPADVDHASVDALAFELVSDASGAPSRV